MVVNDGDHNYRSYTAYRVRYRSVYVFISKRKTTSCWNSGLLTTFLRFVVTHRYRRRSTISHVSNEIHLLSNYIVDQTTIDDTTKSIHLSKCEK